jgi:uncharacterized short protein YbdD (DUF466 family)
MTCTICGLPGLDLRKIGAKLKDGARLMVGQGDYDAYVAHFRTTHGDAPDAPMMTREEFFLSRQAARYGEGRARVFVCC